MQSFWQLVSLMTSLAGFLVVGGVLLMNGESLLSTVIKAVLAFAGLWIAQSVLRGLLGLAAESSAAGSGSNADSESMR